MQFGPRPLGYGGSFVEKSEDGMRYHMVEGIFYYYTNETISWRQQLIMKQPVPVDGVAPEITDSMYSADAWEVINENDLEAMYANRSPTIPSVAGTASIVLSPNTIRNWAIYDSRPGSAPRPGVSFGKNTEPYQRAALEADGFVTPAKATQYRVNNVSVTFVPLASEVDYSNLLRNMDGKESAGTSFVAMGKDVMLRELNKLREKEKEKKPVLPVIRSSSSTPANSRNPSVETKKSVVYGSVIDTFSSGSPTNPDGFVNLVYMPSSYNGIYPEIISYNPNPNGIWSMTYTDYLGGNDVRIRTNVDPLSMDLGPVKPVQVARNIYEADQVKGEYANRWVSVLDETVTYGALTITVPKEFRNVVATMQYEVDENGKGEFKYGAKNIGFCLITWDFDFRLK